MVTGWGSIKEGDEESSNVLRKATVPIVPDDECQECYNKYKLKIFDSMMCAGDMKGNKGVCIVSNSAHLMCHGS